MQQSEGGYVQPSSPSADSRILTEEIAHDLNNMLGAILGYGELAQGAVPDDGPLRRYIENIMAAGLRAKTSIGRLLEAGRFDDAAANDFDSPTKTIARGCGEAIMIVDDEPMLVSLTEEMLAGLGYEPVGYTCPLAALQALRTDLGRFSAILTDETMPGMKGSQLAEHVGGCHADVPVILMTGYASPTVIARATAAGVREILSKPLQSFDIGRALSRALGNTPPNDGPPVAEVGTSTPVGSGAPEEP